MSLESKAKSFEAYGLLSMNMKEVEKSKPKAGGPPKKTSKPDEKRSERPPPQKNPNEKKEDPAVIDPNIPDRTYGDYFCKICDSHMNSDAMWEAHVTGKRHLKNVKKGDTDSKYDDLDVESSIKYEIRNVKDPVIGLNYIHEIRRREPDIPPMYNCFLCCASLATVPLVIEHVLSTKHRLNFVRENNPKDYHLIEAAALTKGQLEPLLAEKAAVLEEEYGRGVVKVKKEKPKLVPTPFKRNNYDDDDDDDDTDDDIKELPVPKKARPSEPKNLSSWKSTEPFSKKSSFTNDVDRREFFQHDNRGGYNLHKGNYSGPDSLRSDKDYLKSEYSRSDPSRREDLHRMDLPRREDFGRIDPPRREDFGRTDFPRRDDFGRIDPLRREDYGRIDPLTKDFSMLDSSRRQEFSRVDPSKRDVFSRLDTPRRDVFSRLDDPLRPFSSRSHSRDFDDYDRRSAEFLRSLNEPRHHKHDLSPERRSDSVNKSFDRSHSFHTESSSSQDNAQASNTKNVLKDFVVQLTSLSKEYFLKIVLMKLQDMENDDLSRNELDVLMKIYSLSQQVICRNLPPQVQQLLKDKFPQNSQAARSKTLPQTNQESSGSSSMNRKFTMNDINELLMKSRGSSDASSNQHPRPFDRPGQPPFNEPSQTQNMPLHSNAAPSPNYQVSSPNFPPLSGPGPQQGNFQMPPQHFAYNNQSSIPGLDGPLMPRPNMNNDFPPFRKF